MNGRQRCTFGISSHESGSTMRKKIANVEVGKSIPARVEDVLDQGRVRPKPHSRLKATSSNVAMSVQMLGESSTTPITARSPRFTAAIRHPPARVVHPVLTP